MKTSMNARDLAQLLGVTDRRIRQLHEEDRLVQLSPGHWCATHALTMRLGERFLADRNESTQDKYTAAAVGWLLRPVPGPIPKGEIKIWVSKARQWGLAKDAAINLLINGSRIIGKNAPTFEV